MWVTRTLPSRGNPVQGAGVLEGGRAPGPHGEDPLRVDEVEVGFLLMLQHLNHPKQPAGEEGG